MSAPVFRFAPSPNGHLHLGHALSALLNRDLAQRAGGRLLLRIEDIDPERSTRAFEASILDDLAWLGLVWEQPVRRQSEHIGEHAAALRTLRARGLLYPCFCTRGDIRAATARDEAWPHDPDGAPLYPGTCRALGAAERERRIADGEPHAWRLDMAKALGESRAPLTWRELDESGESADIAADPAAWGDVVLARRDVPTSYHLAVVVDDAAQNITHVVRGRDLFAATAVHRVLQEVLALPEPLYRHHRLVLGPDGRKLSKREGAQSIRALRQASTTVQDVRRLVGV